MSAARVCFLVGCLAVVAVMVVHFRAEQTRAATGVLKLESRWMDLRREWWSLQSRTARLRSPQRIHDRVTGLRIDLVPPGASAEPEVRLALQAR